MASWSGNGEFSKDSLICRQYSSVPATSSHIPSSSIAFDHLIHAFSHTFFRSWQVQSLESISKEFKTEIRQRERKAKQLQMCIKGSVLKRLIKLPFYMFYHFLPETPRVSTKPEWSPGFRRRRAWIPPRQRTAAMPCGSCMWKSARLEHNSESSCPVPRKMPLAGLNWCGNRTTCFRIYRKQATWVWYIETRQWQALGWSRWSEV